MSTPRKLLLVLLAAFLVAVTLLTWGSIGSITMLLCLMLMGASLLYQHFLTNRDGDDYQMDL